MRKIITFSFIVCAMTFLSCSQNKVKHETKVETDSSLYITKDIKLYGNADSLIARGIISPSIRSASMYIINNPTYNGIKFQVGEINYSAKNTDFIKNITYGILSSIDSAQFFYGEIYKKLILKYKKPNKKETPEHLKNIQLTRVVWYKKDIVVCLLSCIPEDEKGAVTLLFTSPQDTTTFSFFLK